MFILSSIKIIISSSIVGNGIVLQWQIIKQLNMFSTKGANLNNP